MKIFLVLTLLFSIIRLEAATDPKVTQFLEMPISSVGNYLNTREAYPIHKNLITAAIEAHRMDLIEICFRSNGAGGLTVDAIAEMKDLAFQDQVLLMVLKLENSTYWPPDDLDLVAGSQIPLAGYLWPLLAPLRRHFPDLPADGKSIETYAKRLELAEKLEASIAAKTPQVDVIPPIPKQTEILERMPAPGEVKTAPEPISKTAAHEKSSWPIALAGVVLFLLLGAIGWRWVRGRS